MCNATRVRDRGTQIDVGHVVKEQLFEDCLSSGHLSDFSVLELLNDCYIFRVDILIWLESSPIVCCNQRYVIDIVIG
jgi:hypothetical protein